MPTEISEIETWWRAVCSVLISEPHRIRIDTERDGSVACMVQTTDIERDYGARIVLPYERLKLWSQQRLFDYGYYQLRRALAELPERKQVQS